MSGSIGVESSGAGGPCHSVLLLLLAVPIWLQKPQDSQLEEGKPGYLHCLTQATPKPTVVWYRNQMLISEVRRRVYRAPCPAAPFWACLFPTQGEARVALGSETSCGYPL